MHRWCHYYPALSKWADIEALPTYERVELLARLREFPPVGCVFAIAPPTDPASNY